MKPTDAALRSGSAHPVSMGAESGGVPADKELLVVHAEGMVVDQDIGGRVMVPEGLAGEPPCPTVGWQVFGVEKIITKRTWCAATFVTVCSSHALSPQEGGCFWIM